IDNTDPNISCIIYKITPGRVQSRFGSVPGQSFGLAFDSAGNLYTTVNFLAGGPPQIWKFAPDGTSTVFATASRSDIGLADLAFDRFGNLLVSGGPFIQGQDLILKYAPDGTESTFATGLYAVRGVSFDKAGNLLVAEIFTDGTALGNILKFTPGGNQPLSASEMAHPEFLAFQLPPTPPPH